MYCAIKDFKDYDFLGETTTIKENIIDYTRDIETILNKSKDIDFLVVKLPLVSELEEIDLDNLKMLVDARENIRYMVKDSLVEGLPCFYQFGIMNADTLERLTVLGEMGVTDAYVAGELAFNMNEARLIANKYNIKIRVVPNLVQTGGIGFTLLPQREHVNSFWIRPDDLELYKDYVDVIEFVGGSEKQHLFHKIYFIDKRWKANLGIVVAGLEEIYGLNIPREFTEARLNCKKKCLTDKCHFCFKVKAMSNYAVENGIDLREENLI